MIRLLAFDTSGPEIGIALRLGDALETRVEAQSRGQGEVLLPLCETLMAQHRLCWADLDGLGVGIGPGNFTGIRISVSAARGLALGLSLPAIGVSRFETTEFLLPGKAKYAVPAVRDRVYIANAGAYEDAWMASTLDDSAGHAAAFDAAAHIGAPATICLLYTSDAADDMQCVDSGGRRCK